jgi:hypothetical protein
MKTQSVKTLVAIGMVAFGSIAMLAAADAQNTRTGRVASDVATGRQSAGQAFDGQRQNPTPVEVRQSSSTRTAEQISRQENAREQSNQRDTSRRYSPDRIQVPRP